MTHVKAVIPQKLSNGQSDSYSSLSFPLRKLLQEDKILKFFCLLWVILFMHFV